MNDTPHVHIDPADLVRFHDGALDAAAHSTIEHALTTCDVCAAAAARLQHRSARLTAALAVADWQPPADALARIRGAHAAAHAAGGGAAAHAGAPRRTHAAPHRLRVAAAIAVLLLGAALLTTPAAAWLANAAERAWHAVTGAAPELPGAAPATSPGPTAERVYEFVPEPGVLILRITDDDVGGIVLREAAGAAAVLRLAGSPAPEVLLLPREIRISGAHAARIELEVPSRSGSVHVLVGEAAAVVVRREGIGSEFSVPIRQ